MIIQLESNKKCEFIEPGFKEFLKWMEVSLDERGGMRPLPCFTYGIENYCFIRENNKKVIIDQLTDNDCQTIYLVFDMYFGKKSEEFGLAKEKINAESKKTN